jgi:hypothetical protein
MSEQELLGHFLGVVKESDELRRALRLNIISAEVRRLQRECAALRERLAAAERPRMEVVR